MIKNLNPGSSWIQVTNSNYSDPPSSPGALSAGMLRWNSNLNTVEVYNGMSWYCIDNNAVVDLTDIAKQTLSWAYNKMKEENRIKELMARHPSLKDLNDKFEMMKVLCQEEDNKL